MGAVMTLKTDITADLDDVFFDTDEFAEEITYNGASINAIVEYGVNLTHGETAAAQAQILVKKADVSAPQPRDTVVIGSTTYTVQSTLKGDGYTWTLNLVTNSRPRIR